MSNQEINSTYNKFRGVKGTVGDMNVLTSITHYFLFDASYDIFTKHVRTLPLRQEPKRIVKRMGELYDNFFTCFLAPFSLDQRIYLGDKSDALREHIAYDVERARIAMMDCCEGDTVERQMEIANIWLCNRFASEARSFYQRVWKKDGFRMRGALYTKPDSDKDIDGILKYTLLLTETLYGEGEDVSEKHFARFQSCVSALTRKIADWLNNDYYDEIRRTDS
jgi:hypothetical protein